MWLQRHPFLPLQPIVLTEQQYFVPNYDTILDSKLYQVCNKEVGWLNTGNFTQDFLPCNLCLGYPLKPVFCPPTPRMITSFLVLSLSTLAMVTSYYFPDQFVCSFYSIRITFFLSSLSRFTWPTELSGISFDHSRSKSFVQENYSTTFYKLWKTNIHATYNLHLSMMIQNM